MKMNLNPKEETLLIIHTSSPINNSRIYKMILSEQNGREVNFLVSKYADKVKQVHLYGKIENLKYLHNDFHGVIKVFARNKEEVITHSKMLAERRCFICPEFPVEKCVNISFITSRRIAVDLLYKIDHMERDTVLKILNYYLHHSSLETAVEPFHSILMSGLKKRKISLWHLHLLFPGQLKEYFESIPKKHPACMSCHHFPICFSWAKYKKDTCDLWKAILDRLHKSAAEIKGCLRSDLFGFGVSGSGIFEFFDSMLFYDFF